jgi:hypothetical protein
MAIIGFVVLIVGLVILADDIASTLARWIVRRIIKKD